MTQTIKIRALVTAAGLCLLAGCATQRLDLAPASPSSPWSPDGIGSDNFAVPANPAVADLSPPPMISRDHAYQLPELINIAQMQNPDTRIAWQHARQAALAVGMVEATYLPMISASVIGGYHNTHTPLPHGINVDTSASAVVPAVALQWLIFDFGQRNAFHEVAKNTSYAANVAFNGIHQKIIYDVTRTYYQYGAAQSRRKITQEALHNSQMILDAAQARRQNGVATTVEVALARQQVAQSELNRVVAEGTERDAWQALLGAMGVSATTQLEVAYSENAPLPQTTSAPTQQMIKLALSQRPDILASYAAVQSAKAGIKGAEADFLPKVYLAGVAAGGNGRFDVEGLPSIGTQTSSSTILLGVSVPLYDGGIRAARVKEAESRAAVADETFQNLQELAVREIVVAADTLRSALEANKAAVNLVKTAFISYDAALETYRNGVGTITVANEAANGLLHARQMSTDAHAAALIAAANLAFVMGKMTRAD